MFDLSVRTVIIIMVVMSIACMTGGVVRLIPTAGLTLIPWMVKML